MAQILQNLIIGILLFSVLIGTMLSVIGGMNTQYGEKFDNETVSPLFTQVEETSDLTDSMTSKLTNISSSDENALTQMAKGSFQIFLLGINYVGTAHGMITRAGNDLGVPVLIINFALAALSLFIVIGITQIIFRAF